MFKRLSLTNSNPAPPNPHITKVMLATIHRRWRRYKF